MLEILLTHGSIWINPFHVTAIEPTSSPPMNDEPGSFITMQNNSGWNTPYSPNELAKKINEAKQPARYFPAGAN